MELQTAFQKTWNEVEIAFKNQHIKNHELFVFVFCKAFVSNAPDLHPIYDARLIPNQGHRPNLVIWADRGEPTVIFIGTVKFEPESFAALKKGIKDLNEYASRPAIEVLMSNECTEIMKVSPNVEFGYFVISDLTSTAISKGVTSLGLSQHELTRFHFAYGSANGHSHFKYQEPQLMRVKR